MKASKYEAYGVLDNKAPDARVVKLVDTQDLKSCDLTVVPVRFRPRAPFKFILGGVK